MKQFPKLRPEDFRTYVQNLKDHELAPTQELVAEDPVLTAIIGNEVWRRVCERLPSTGYLL